MRIYIVSDLEGVAGVYKWEDTEDDHPENHEERCRQRRWLAEEVNAAARGFFDGGATDVWVLDGHGTGYTIDIELVEPRVRILHGTQHPAYCVGLDENCAALGSIGTHAKAETYGANMYHTGTESVRGEWLNGISVGETGRQAFLAGHYGVPFIFCAGDAWACKEMEELVPGCVTVPVKEGMSRLSAKTLVPAKACELIYAGARESMNRIGLIEPLRLEPPIVCRREFYQPTFDLENPPAVGRVIDSHTQETEAKDMPALLAKAYGHYPDWQPFWKQYPCSGNCQI